MALSLSLSLSPVFLWKKKLVSRVFRYPKVSEVCIRTNKTCNKKKNSLALVFSNSESADHLIQYGVVSLAPRCAELCESISLGVQRKVCPFPRFPFLPACKPPLSRGWKTQPGRLKMEERGLRLIIIAAAASCLLYSCPNEEGVRQLKQLAQLSRFLNRE